MQYQFFTLILLFLIFFFGGVLVFCVFFLYFFHIWGRHGRVYMVVGFTFTCVISVYYRKSYEFEPR
jgi:hypothetical protein